MRQDNVRNQYANRRPSSPLTIEQRTKLDAWVENAAWYIADRLIDTWRSNA